MVETTSKASEIRRLLKKENLSARDIAKKVKCSYTYVYVVAAATGKKYNLPNKQGKHPRIGWDSPIFSFLRIIMVKPTFRNEIVKIFKGNGRHETAIGRVYIDLRMRGFPINRTLITGCGGGPGKSKIGKKRTIYYLDSQREQALKMIAKLKGMKFNRVTEISHAILDGHYPKTRGNPDILGIIKDDD